MAQLINNPQSRAATLKGMDEIIPNLWLGDVISTYNLEALQGKQITHVMSLIDQPLPQWLRTRYQDLGIEHTVFMIQDDALQDILAIMSKACDMIDSTINSGNGVLVHCGLGVSRSGSIVVGYVMRSNKVDREKALKFVKTRRPRVQPNSGFWQQLKVYEECNLEVWERNCHDEVEKPPYTEWKEEARKAMEERVRAWGQPKELPVDRQVSPTSRS